MKNYEFTVSIDADANTVWDALWKAENYLQWAKVFSPETYADNYDWKEGNIVKFLGKDNNGMYAVIEEHVPALQMTFKYLGEIVDGKEVPFEMHQTKELGGTESYLLRPQEMGTDLNVEVVFPEEYEDFLKEKYPLALQKIKEIAES